MAHPLLGTHPVFAALAGDLRDRPGRLEETDGDPARAAVAIILRTRVAERGGSETSPLASPVSPLSSSVRRLDVLLIERAVRDDDPWSGQIALPGGRRDPADATLQDTAIRETLEETGLDLGAEGYALGMLDELRPRTPVLPSIIVTPFVFVTAADRPFVPSDELADAFWAPWSLFADPLAVEERPVRVRGATWRVASYAVGERVVWGMTERMLRQLAARLHGLQRGLAADG